MQPTSTLGLLRPLKWQWKPMASRSPGMRLRQRRRRRARPGRRRGPHTTIASVKCWPVRARAQPKLLTCVATAGYGAKAIVSSRRRIAGLLSMPLGMRSPGRLSQACRRSTGRCRRGVACSRTRTACATAATSCCATASLPMSCWRCSDSYPAWVRRFSTCAARPTCSQRAAACASSRAPTHARMLASRPCSTVG